MTARAGREDGFALISAMVIMTVLLGLGFALLTYTDNQQHAAAYEQQGEQAYALAEAALNAQIFGLSVQWPTSRVPDASSCNAVNGATTTGCPSPSSLSTAYASTGPSTCPANTPRDPWNAGTPTTNGWTTYVRGDGGGTSQLYNSATDAAQPAYDAGDHTVWVRAVGVANCKMSVVLTKVSAQYMPITLPQVAVDSNGFKTSNNGGHGGTPIIDTIGHYAVPNQGTANPSSTAGPVSVRCSGLTSGQCRQYQASKGQIAPDTSGAPADPAQAINATQLAALRNAAIINGTWWGVGSPNGTCPSQMGQLTGAPTFVDGPCTIIITGHSYANGAAPNDPNYPGTPGVLVLNNGTISFGGGSTFFGVIYGVNAQGAGGLPCSGPGSDVVSLGGSATVQGAIIVDGTGTTCFGSNAANLVYDVRGFHAAQGWAGAAATPNSFRVLPQGQ